MVLKKGTTLYEAPPRPFIPCAYEGCPVEAKVRVRTKTGWAALCISSGTHVGHYERQNQDEAKAYSEKHNLNTPADHLEHVKALMRKPKQHSAEAHWLRVLEHSKSLLARKYAEDALRRIRGREREAGEDDQEFYEQEPMLNV